jgi:Holliday junction resolvase RusA-like endonuclease
LPREEDVISIHLPAPFPAPHIRKGANGGWFLDKNYQRWRDEAEALIRRGYHAGALVGPVELVITCVSERLASRPEWLPLDVWKRGTRVLRPVRPDLENFCEAVADALQVPKHMRKVVGVRGYPLADDGQVARLVAEDWMGARGEEAHTLVTIRTLGWESVATPEAA